MKKLVIAILASMLFTSCATLKPTERLTVTSFSDYREYAKEGFLISPNPYTYDFESVGELLIAVVPAITKAERDILVAGEYKKRFTIGYEEIPFDELVAMAVEEAKSKGADALVNFAIEKEYFHSGQGMTYASGYRYYIKGYCIKRK